MGCEASNHRIRFGKYEGKRLGDIDFDYLLWLREWDRLREPLKSNVEEEIEYRKAQRRAKLNGRNGIEIPIHLKDTLDKIRQAGFRQLSHRYHPDHAGGSNKEMRYVLEANDLLKDIIGGER